jgi:hypothetical protein
MDGDFTTRKRAILAGLAFLILADLGLGIYRWRLSASPGTTPQSLAEENTRLKLLRADIERSETIERNIPKSIQDCDKFEKLLPPVTSASSLVSEELGEIAKKSGLQIQGITFHDKEMAGRNITEREMEASVSGEYQSVVRFLNGLERSQNMYVVDSLELGSETQSPNTIRVTLHMKTFFRTVSV